MGFMAKRASVFIPEYSISYEPGDWMGVFTTLKKALKQIENRCLLDCGHDHHYITEYIPNDRTQNLWDALIIDGEWKTIKRD